MNIGAAIALQVVAGRDAGRRVALSRLTGSLDNSIDCPHCPLC